MEFDGQKLTWNGSGSFKATTGLPGFQMPENQCIKDSGPIPEGVYKVLVTDRGDRKSTRLNSSHLVISYAVFCLKKKKTRPQPLISQIDFHHPLAYPPRSPFVYILLPLA